jgi:hypothetical protein
LWSGGNNVSSANNTFSASGTYTVTVTADNGCTAVASKSITVSAAGAVVFSSSSVASVCQGGSATLTATGYIPSGAADDFTYSSASGTFTPLTGGTVISKLAGDDSVSAAIPIGFTYVGFGNPYTDVYASSNGFLSFNSGLAGLGGANTATYTNSLTAPNAAIIPVIAPLWDDLNGNVGTASYLTTGTAGSRVFTFEWLNWKWNYQATSAVISMQVKLYESNGRIEFIYRSEGGAVSTGTASIEQCYKFGNSQQYHRNQ